MTGGRSAETREVHALSSYALTYVALIAPADGVRGRDAEEVRRVRLQALQRVAGLCDASKLHN